MTSMATAASQLAAVMGKKVDRSAAGLPASTTGAIFTISGGRVMVTSIIGEVTTAIQAQANAVKLQFDPTDAGATQDLSATIETNAAAVGTMYSITGTPATAMQSALNFMSPDKMLARPLVLKPGSILVSAAATNTGQVKWTLTYVALDNGAAVSAA